MDLNKLEKEIDVIVKLFNKDEFIYQLLLAYGLPKASITRLKKGDYNQSKNAGEILWKKNIFFKVAQEQDLHLTIDEAKKDKAILKHKPRLIRIAVNNLAGVPSIVYGIFGLGFFVYILGGNIDELFYPESAPAPV